MTMLRQVLDHQRAIDGGNAVVGMSRSVFANSFCERFELKMITKLAYGPREI